MRSKGEIRTAYFIIGIIITAVIVGAGVWTLKPAKKVGGKKPYAGKVLKVGIWETGSEEKAWRASFEEPFEEKTGCDVRFTYAWDWTPKLKAAPAGSPPVDVFLMAGDDYATAMELDLLLPIRWENIPNKKYIWDTLKDRMPSMKYAVPLEANPMVLLYRKDKVEEPVTSWDDIWRDEFKGKITIESWWPYWVYVIAGASDYEPFYKAPFTEEGRKAIKEAGEKLDERIFSWYGAGGEMRSSISAGDAWIADYYLAGSSSMAHKHPDKYAVSIPKEGTTAYFCQVGIAKGTDVRNLGEEFINFILSEKREEEYMLKKPQHQIIWANKKTTDVADELWPGIKKIYPREEADWKNIRFLRAKDLEPYKDNLTSWFAEMRG